MPSVETTLAEAVAPGGQVAVAAPGIRYGTIEQGTATVTVGGFPQPDASFAVDLLAETVHAINNGTNPWAAGAKLVVSWEGALASGPPGGGGGTDPALEARVTALEAEDVKIWAQFQTAADIISTDMGVLEDRIAALEAGGTGAIPVQFNFHFVGSPAESAVYTIPTSLAVTIPAGLAGSTVYDRTQCTSNAIFIISRIDHVTHAITTLGSITVTRPSHFSCTLAGPGGAMAAGDVLQITAPTPDPTLADVSFAIMATQTSAASKPGDQP